MTSLAGLSDELRKAAYEASDALRRKVLVYRTKGWIFTYKEKDGYHAFTAQLWPIGRSSTMEDWQFAGRVAHNLGAPQGPDHTPQSILLAPDSEHRWEWID